MKRIVVLGSTGSIGTQTVDVVRQHSDELEIVGLAVNTRVGDMLEQARAHNVRNLAVGDERLADQPIASEVREQAGARHLLEHKSSRKTRRLATDQVLETADVKRVKRLLGK